MPGLGVEPEDPESDVELVERERDAPPPEDPESDVELAERERDSPPPERGKRESGDSPPGPRGTGGGTAPSAAVTRPTLRGGGPPRGRWRGRLAAAGGPGPGSAEPYCLFEAKSSS